MDLTKDSNQTGERLSAESREPRRFAGTMLGDYGHICALFHSPDEEYRALLPFIKEGLECGEKAVHVIDPQLREQHLQRLGGVGVNRLRFSVSCSTYCCACCNWTSPIRG
jgi:hypothetical protein